MAYDIYIVRTEGKSQLVVQCDRSNRPEFQKISH